MTSTTPESPNSNALNVPSAASEFGVGLLEMRDSGVTESTWSLFSAG